MASGGAGLGREVCGSRGDPTWAPGSRHSLRARQRRWGERLGDGEPRRFSSSGPFPDPSKRVGGFFSPLLLNSAYKALLQVFSREAEAWRAPGRGSPRRRWTEARSGHPRAPGSGNRNAHAGIFGARCGLFFSFFFCPFSRCLWPRVCPNLPPHPKSESFRILLAGLYRRDHIRGVLQDGGRSCSPF